MKIIFGFLALFVANLLVAKRAEVFTCALTNTEASNKTTRNSNLILKNALLIPPQFQKQEKCEVQPYI